MISALILAAAVAGQSAAVPAEPASEAPTAPTTFRAKAKPSGKKPMTKAEAQAQSVVDRRKARRRAYNQREANAAALEAAEYEARLAAYQKAVKEQEAYYVKMGPIWAAENANLIQQQRNGLLAESNAIARKKADYDAWILWQIRNSR